MFPASMATLPKLLVFDSHPVQYRVPIWQTLEALSPGCVHVAYASDCSVRGHADADFGQTFAWDEPMLSGYDHTILNCEKGEPLAGWGSLTGEGVSQLITQLQPSAVLLTGLNYRYDLMAYLAARRHNIPVWLRCETQDYALSRSALKDQLRSLVYRTAYLGLNHVFFIGQLNKQHYLRHGIDSTQLTPAHYGTVDRYAHVTNAEKTQLRAQARVAAGIAATSHVVGFSGKFIAKKNPDILYKMLDHLPVELRRRTHLYFMGSGGLESELRQLAAAALQQYGVPTYFSGFVNQSQLAGHYLAFDTLVLPSQRQGETWGLVANEAMQAGCGVVVSDAVGCGADFWNWERFRVFTTGVAAALAKAVAELAVFPRDTEWARPKLRNYSIQATATALATELGKLSPQPAVSNIG